MARPYKCPYCGGSRTRWKGVRMRQTDKVRLRKCNECGRKFTTKRTIPLQPEAGEGP